MKFNSIKFKISVLYTVILGIILVLYSGYLYYSLYSTLYDALDNELKIKAQAYSDGIDQYLAVLGRDHSSFIYALRMLVTLKEIPLSKYHNLQPADKVKLQNLNQQWLKKYDKLDLSEDFINFLGEKGISLSRSSKLHTELMRIFVSKMNVNLNQVSLTKFKYKKKNLRLIQVPYYNGDNLYFIQIGTSQKPIIELLEQRLFLLMVSIPVILIISSFIGRFLTSRMLAPVFEITEKANRITSEDLSARIKTEDIDEEMYSLVRAFNMMISRLEKSFKHIEEFSSQVAHELKTPLAIIRGECELALRKSRSLEEYKRVIIINLEESQKMRRIIKDLFLLAKLDYHPKIFKFEKFNGKNFFKEIYEQSVLLASKKSISVHLDLSPKVATIRGDKLHLRRLFFNVIHNAIKFSSARSQIFIKVWMKNNEIYSSIIDQGVGIPQEDLPKIFNRFYHQQRITDETERGIGLGLNIAMSIAQIHKGMIHVESIVNQGTTFHIRLPLNL